jgi:hypothetical protein
LLKPSGYAKGIIDKPAEIRQSPQLRSSRQNPPQNEQIVVKPKPLVGYSPKKAGSGTVTGRVESSPKVVIPMPEPAVVATTSLSVN